MIKYLVVGVCIGAGAVLAWLNRCKLITGTKDLVSKSPIKF